EHLMQDAPDSFERVCLIGNHESYLLRFLDDSSVAANWMDNGGRETLSSYGVASPPWIDRAGIAEEIQADLCAKLPAAHEWFLRSLVHSHREGDYFFTHAGVRPGVALERQKPHDLMWIRDEFLSDQRDFGAVVVHGHSIASAPENLANRIGVDTGAYASGHLTCAVLFETERRFLTT
ncbi:MAG: serine/threonine protein phosphatase, partial [Alphaproteobacteria bacterium]|nr:serine/threonine protein phosphatase [Alphaproteobacteria bacterium]